MQRFTYFFPDGHSEVRIQPQAPLPRPGDVWIRGAYGPDIEPDPSNVRVGESGVEAWRIILWLRLSHDDRRRLLRDYPAMLRGQDIDAALWFYDKHRVEIEREIEHELEAV